MSASSRPASHGSPTGEVVPPTDLELMMLADGELDEARRLQVEAFLSGTLLLGHGDPMDRGERVDPADVAAARGKIAGLRTLSAVLGATGAWPERAGIDVVDGVFAALDREPAAPAADAVAKARADLRAEPVLRTEPVIKAAPESRATLDGAAASGRGGSAAAARPANDNGRTIFGLALAAAAAAAGLFLWGRGGADTIPPTHATRATTEVVPDQPSPAMVPSGSGDGLDPREPAVAAVADARYGVEVASVDFGQRSGAIYYVPSPKGVDEAASAAVTTVVWLSDE